MPMLSYTNMQILNINKILTSYLQIQNYKINRITIKALQIVITKRGCVCVCVIWLPTVPHMVTGTCVMCCKRTALSVLFPVGGVSNGVV